MRSVVLGMLLLIALVRAVLSALPMEPLDDLPPTVAVSTHAGALDRSQACSEQAAPDDDDGLAVPDHDDDEDELFLALAPASQGLLPDCVWHDELADYADSRDAQHRLERPPQA